MIRHYRKLPRFTGSLVVLAAVLYLTLAPHPLPDNDIALFAGADKVVHFLMFFGLAAVELFDLSLLARRRPRWQVAALVCLSTALFGGVIELLQQAMGMGRGADWLDFAADSAGAIAAWCLMGVISRIANNGKGE